MSIVQKTKLMQVLERIASALERANDIQAKLLETTDPINVLEQWPDDGKPRFTYTDEETEIIREQLAKRGVEYKERV